MATEPPRRAQPPPAGGDGAEPEPEPELEAAAAGAGGWRRGLNGCVPLAHQVAGHMYGKDKGEDTGSHSKAVPASKTASTTMQVRVQRLAISKTCVFR